MYARIHFSLNALSGYCACLRYVGSAKISASNGWMMVVLEKSEKASEEKILQNLERIAFWALLKGFETIVSFKSSKTHF